MLDRLSLTLPRRRAFLLIASLLLLQLPHSTYTLAESLASRAHDTQCSTRLVVLLDGISSTSANVTTDFKQIIKQALSKIGYAQAPIAFSYSYPSEEYDATATYNALPNTGVKALDDTVKHLLNAYPGACIDLIGWSLGGAVAFQYMRLALNTAEGKQIKHLITLDSPVNGVSHSTLVGIAGLIRNYDVLHLLTFANSSSGMFLAAEHQDPSTIPENRKIANTLSEQMVLKTFSSKDDLVVPPEDAEISGVKQEFQLGTNCLQLPPDSVACIGHSQVLRSPKVMNTLVAVLKQPPPNVPASGSVLYQADWSQGTDGWTNLPGFPSQPWTASNGVLSGSYFAVIPPFNPGQLGISDYAVQAEIRVTASPWNFKIFARQPADQMGYTEALVDTDSGSQVRCESVLNSNQGTFNPGQDWHTYRIERTCPISWGEPGGGSREAGAACILGDKSWVGRRGSSPDAGGP